MRNRGDAYHKSGERGIFLVADVLVLLQIIRNMIRLIFMKLIACCRGVGGFSTRYGVKWY